MRLTGREIDKLLIFTAADVARRHASFSVGDWPMSRVTLGVGGPVGSGKTALLDGLCKRLRDRHSIAVITNDI